MASIFSRIVSGELPCYKVAETDTFMAFLDIRPQVKGHTLCIPKREEDYIFDLSDEELSGLMLFSKRVAKALQEVVPCKRIGIAVVGLEIPHAHVHLMPINTVSDLGFRQPLEMTPEELAALAAQIAERVRLDT
ncbi:MAG: HIT family protein [Saprospiraceae bacterium]|nr:HIT family protein [Saprospiraceae bacterium]MDW8482788.1 HIT family protein [Saprospiraceae bacterium]